MTEGMFRSVRNLGLISVAASVLAVGCGGPTAAVRGTVLHLFVLLAPSESVSNRFTAVFAYLDDAPRQRMVAEIRLELFHGREGAGARLGWSITHHDLEVRVSRADLRKAIEQAVPAGMMAEDDFPWLEARRLAVLDLELLRCLE